MHARRKRRSVAGAFCAVVVAAGVAACSASSLSTPSGDAGADAPTLPVRHPDAAIGTGVGGTEAGATGFDGTTGQSCQSDADCGSLHINVCSKGALPATFDGVTAQLFATPVCIMPPSAGTGNCDPGPAGTLRFCDSADPQDPTSPGICLSITTPQQAGPGNGLCLPACRFALDGSAATGCAGHNACAPVNFLLDPKTNVVTGYGVCQGACQADADCSQLGAGWSCQQDLGLCVQTQSARTKKIGDACTNMGPMSDTSSGACNCFSLSGVASAYCTSQCVVGASNCPSGWVCDAGEPSSLDFLGPAGDIVVAGPMTQTPGLLGYCMPACTPSDAGAPPDAGAIDAGGQDAGDSGSAGPVEGGVDAAGAAQCVSPATCISGTVAGPDCQPM